MSSYQYRKFHCGDTTILPPSYLHNGISFTGKKTSLYRIRAQGIARYGDLLILYKRIRIPDGLNFGRQSLYRNSNQSIWAFHNRLMALSLGWCWNNFTFGHTALQLDFVELCDLFDLSSMANLCICLVFFPAMAFSRWLLTCLILHWKSGPSRVLYLSQG